MSGCGALKRPFIFDSEGQAAARVRAALEYVSLAREYNAVHVQVAKHLNVSSLYRFGAMLCKCRLPSASMQEVSVSSVQRCACADRLAFRFKMYAFFVKVSRTGNPLKAAQVRAHNL